MLVPAAGGPGRHPLSDERVSTELARRAVEIDAAFEAIEPVLRALVPLQFEDGFAQRARAQLQRELGVDAAPELFEATWSRPLDVRALTAHCVLATFRRLADRPHGRSAAPNADGEDAQTIIGRWGFHAIDITPCADGRLAGVVDYILRVPPAVVISRSSFAGAMFDVEAALAQWESVELRRWRKGVPNAASEPTRYLKLGVYHYSSADPARQGCAAHGSDRDRAARALLERLEQLQAAVEATHCCGAAIGALLVGVDTDTDAIRMHVPDANGRMAIDRIVDNAALYEATLPLPREAAKDAIRDAVAACAGVDPFDPATEGMRWLCGYLLKNNIGQIEAVRTAYGGPYPDAGHTERLIVVGDPIDGVQLRNLAFAAQMETVEEGASDLDIGVRILEGLTRPRDLAVPILAHLNYDARIPGARERANRRAGRLRDAIEARYGELAAAGRLHVEAFVRAGDGTPLEPVQSLSPTETRK
jgi:carboxysome shell carbonic anhydrase